MRRGSLGTRLLSMRELEDLLRDENLFPPADTFAILSRPEEARLDLLKAFLPDLSKMWEEGRVFNAERELRFKRREGMFVAFLLTEGALPEGFKEREGPFDVGEEVSLPLWGRGEGGRFVEARIPRPLRYPVRGRRAVLRGLPYLREGIVVALRLTKVVGLDEEGRS